MRTLQATMSTKRRMYLERLSTAVAGQGPRGPVMQDCRDLGWTEPLLQKGHEFALQSVLLGDLGTKEAVRLAGWRFSGMDMLTDAGRAALDRPEEEYEAMRREIRHGWYVARRYG